MFFYHTYTFFCWLTLVEIGSRWPIHVQDGPLGMMALGMKAGRENSRPDRHRIPRILLKYRIDGKKQEQENSRD
jgi:hypothetical protein